MQQLYVLVNCSPVPGSDEISSVQSYLIGGADQGSGV